MVVNGRTEATVTQAVDEIRKKHPEARRERSAASLSKADAGEAAVRRFEKVDVLANTFEPKPFAEILDADWSAMIEAKSMSGARLSRRWLPRMLAAGGRRIIFISSESAMNIPRSCFMRAGQRQGRRRSRAARRKLGRRPQSP
jgi:NAD(P)-dependent dehydrogenase (short-subunit alcohol dehydrogenase family)